jgi:myo-inositol-1(or 4)-monophosphatase
VNHTRLENHAATEQGRIALRAAFAAGRALKRKFFEPREIRSKGLRDIVTDADFAADRSARRILERAFPEYAILSEEDSAPPRRAEYVWMMDPLDGTTNYAHRIPIFSVSLALTRRGQPVVGVVYDPMRDECFFAERGKGAQRNGVAIRAGKTDALERAIIGYELPRVPEIRALGMRLFTHFAMQGVTARIGGSAALSLCYVGAGRLDVYFQPTLSAWDVAAGILIAREAGARVAHFDGSPATLRGGAYLATAPKLYPKVIRQLKSQLDSR